MSDLHTQLHTLAAHVRDPATQPGPAGIEARRLKIYRDLVFNNLDGLLRSGFPVLCKTLGSVNWQVLLREFLIHHHSHTPLFTQLGREFVEFLEAEAAPDPLRPWRAELADYERAELDLQLRDGIVPAHDPDGDVLNHVPLLTPHCITLAYRWPVEQIGPDNQPSTPPTEPTLLLLRRATEGRVHFSKLSPPLYRLLELIKTNQQRSGRELLRQLADEASQADFDAFLQQVRPMLERLRTEQVLIGTRIV